MTTKHTRNTDSRWRRILIQRRVNARVDHLRPQRWNWSAVVRPLDRRLAEQSVDVLPRVEVHNLRDFWLDGLFAAISENFYLGYVTLFALSYGATNGQVGLVTAFANLLGAISLFPGARLVESVGRRKPVVVWSAGVFGRLALLALALFPFIIKQPLWAIVLIIGFNGLRAFMGNLANPGWTSLVADLIPDAIRGRYFSSRNIAMGVAALLITPLAGWLIKVGNDWIGSTVLGYQLVFFLAFATGMISTFFFQRIVEPAPTTEKPAEHHPGDLRRAIGHSPGFVGLVVSAFIWNLALQIAAPFFNVYLVDAFETSTTTIGLLAAVSSLTALFGQRLFGRVLDQKGAFRVQILTGLLIPVLPLAWIFITAAWQVAIINTFGGLLWAGYNLASFILLLTLTPEDQRPRAVALYQTAVFASAVAGPLLGGFLADAVSFKLIFALSGIGRLLGTLLFVWFAARPFQKLMANQPSSSLPPV